MQFFKKLIDIIDENDKLKKQILRKSIERLKKYRYNDCFHNWEFYESSDFIHFRCANFCSGIKNCTHDFEVDKNKISIKNINLFNITCNKCGKYEHLFLKIKDE